MSDLIPFEFDNAKVRVVQGDAGEPLFVAADVAKVLGYSKPENAVPRHCKAATTTPKRGGGTYTLIPERDVYRLIMRSKLPSAERFEEWVVGTVLPQIRKTGQYAPAVTQLPDFTNPAEAARAWASEYEGREQAEKSLAEAKPKVDFHDRVSEAVNGHTVREVAKMLGTGQNRLFAFLRRQGVLMRDNQPYQRYVDAGYFRVLEKQYSDARGESHIYTRTLVTGRGVTFIYRLLDKKAPTTIEQQAAHG